MDKRAIKFRAWDKKEKKMLLSVGIATDGTIFTVKSIAKVKISDELKTQNASCEAYMKDEIELMQYTGLKDKNGKEIFEGDIVEFDNTIMECKWFQKKCMFIFYQKEWQEIHEVTTDNSEECKIIRNIYENQEP